MVRAADIGIEFKADETGCFQITKVHPGSAMESGQVDIGDILYEIDGVKVLYGIGPNGRPLPEVEVREMMRGLEGSVLNLRIQKGRLGRIAHVVLIRSSVEDYPSSRGTPPPPQPARVPERERSAPPREPEERTRERSTRERSAPPDAAPIMQPHKLQLAAPLPQQFQYSSQRIVQVPGMQLPMTRTVQMQVPVSMMMPRTATMIIPPPKERPLPPDMTDDKMYWRQYQPKEPDRFGLGISFKLLSDGRLSVQSLVEGGPAKLSRQEICEKDILCEIDRQVIVGQPVQVMRTMLESKRIGQPVYLGLLRVGHEGLAEVKILKGETGLRCGVGIVFKSDAVGQKWVRIAQVVPGGAAEKAVAPLNANEVMHTNDRVLEIDGEDISCQPLDLWKHRLRGEFGTHIAMTFADSKAKKYKVNMYRDYIDQTKVDPNCLNIPPPTAAEETPIKPQGYFPPLLKMQGQGIMPDGSLGRPVPNPELWKSFIDEGVPDPKNPTSFFLWRGQTLTQPEYLPDQSSCKIFRITENNMEELVYWGPGCRERVEIPVALPKQETTEKKEPAAPLDNRTVDAMKKAEAGPEPVKPADAAKKVPPPPPPEDNRALMNRNDQRERSAPPEKSPRAERERSSAPEEVVKKSPVPAKNPDPVKKVEKSPEKREPEAPVVKEDEIDDESLLILPDGRRLEAKKIEKVLKKHLDAVAHVMVVGSKRKFLSCLLTIKTLGSEAVSKGQDPESVPNHLDLAGPALDLAKSVGISITSVLQARSSIDFRTKGLLPCFAKANQEIGSLFQCQVKRFTILTATFSPKTGELLSDQTLNRMNIKNKYRNNVIEGMYKEKE